MSEYRNPFNLGAGVSLPELDERTEVLQHAQIALERTRRERHAKSLLVLEPRGAGKSGPA